MSQRSRRFLAAKERAVLPTALDHPTAQAEGDLATLVPAMSALGDHGQDRPVARTAAPPAERPRSPLERSGKRVRELAAQVAGWGRQHPLRVVGAAAALVAASGFLYGLMHGKADKAKRLVGAAKQAKARVKARVKAGVGEAVKAVARRGPRSGRAALATN
jgi:hypothetical protein